ncbi:MAG: BRO family protein [Alphaproteobacteria bacterium]|nr:MAG: BRO family protein [Alphaproteobacteria bacterium]
MTHTFTAGTEGPHKIRTVTLKDAPWFVAKDVVDILGLWPSEYRRLDAMEKCLLRRTQLGMKAGRAMTGISESGLYTLILRSNKPQAVPFQDWVTQEVLPSIRKTGG